MFQTSHGDIETPTFMPVGSLGPVKGLEPDDVRRCGFGLVLNNAYHLYLRPGHRLIAELGGLHRFTGWSGAILTDSGGYQIFSLSDLCKVSDDGVTFKSHLDGSLHHLTPELCMEIQVALGSDVIMALDECPQYPCSEERAQEAVQRTTKWVHRCLSVPRDRHQAFFGIVQGGLCVDLRAEAARALVKLGLDGYALGGLSLGEDKATMFHMVESVIQELPDNRPRYLMGVGMPEDLVEGVARGIDLFDCVIPSRHGRTGWLFTSEGRLLIKNAQYSRDERPIDSQCGCSVCRKYSRAYLRHLFLSNEMLGVRLNTLHNLWYYGNLMAQLRTAIRENRLGEFRSQFYAKRERIGEDLVSERGYEEFSHIKTNSSQKGRNDDIVRGLGTRSGIRG